SRGILYALDEENGKLLWAVRVGPDVYDRPAIAQVHLPEGPTDLALVASNVAGQPALTAYVLRTGVAKWSQPLTPKAGPGGDVSKLPPAPAAGAAAIIGTKAFVPIHDAAGSVLVFDIANGKKIGRITIGQAIGPGAFVRPGTNHLYVAGSPPHLRLRRGTDRIRRRSPVPPRHPHGPSQRHAPHCADDPRPAGRRSVAAIPGAVASGRLRGDETAGTPAAADADHFPGCAALARTARDHGRFAAQRMGVVPAGLGQRTPHGRDRPQSVPHLRHQPTGQ